MGSNANGSALTHSAGGVSRRRYERERRARQEAEELLEAKSRKLYVAYEALKRQAAGLEAAVLERTSELDTARKDAEATNSAKSVFLAHMSHEIRTPLNGVLGMAAALAETDLNLEQQKMLEVLIESGDLLLSVLNDILDLTKVEAGELELDITPCSINDLFESVCKQFELQVRQKGLSFAIVYGGMLEEDNVWAEFDPTRLRQVLGNLLSNAVKFTLEGAITMKATVTQLNDGRLNLDFSIRDTGCGIPEDKQHRLFQPFAQADASISRRYGGTGLGLVISRKICQLMGGDISFTSELGKGTEFYGSILIEAARARQEPQKYITEHCETILRNTKWRIIAAEDNQANQLVLSHMLKDYDLDLAIVKDGLQAVSLWRRQGADLILMDVNMPVMDGLTATALIRSEEALQSIQPVPVIATSANAMLHQISSYLEHGMDDHVAKPLRKAALLKAMAHALERRTADQGPLEA